MPLVALRHKVGDGRDTEGPQAKQLLQALQQAERTLTVSEPLRALCGWMTATSSGCSSLPIPICGAGLIDRKYCNHGGW